MVNVISEANLLEINTKHSCVSSAGRSDDSLGATLLAMKLKEENVQSFDAELSIRMI